MSQVSVTIDGRKYRLACNEGEEARLESLAGTIDEKIGEMRKTFGEIGDQRLVIMAALTLADSLAEARDEATAQRKRSDDADERANALALKLDALGSRLESVAARLGGRSRLLSRQCRRPFRLVAGADVKRVIPGLATLDYWAAL